jgi:hypothetical protein
VMTAFQAVYYQRLGRHLEDTRQGRCEPVLPPDRAKPPAR